MHIVLFEMFPRVFKLTADIFWTIIVYFLCKFLTTFLRKLTKMRSKHVMTFIVIASKLHRNMLEVFYLINIHGQYINIHEVTDFHDGFLIQCYSSPLR